MDVEVEAALQKLNLPSVRVVPLSQAESMFPALLAAKRDRTMGEYCWTMTPFIPELVLRLQPEIQRVTYVDADLFFLSSPAPIFVELDRSGKDVLITEHDYGKARDSTAISGRFCVQFIPFRNTPQARNILQVWQGQCLEWCYDRHEPGRFGDQMYLDSWPARWGATVHILQDNELILAPWNHPRKSHRRAVFYHMHSLRIWKELRIRYVSGYRILDERLQCVYLPYKQLLVGTLKSISSKGIECQFPSIPRGGFEVLRRFKRWLVGKEKWSTVRIDLMEPQSVPILRPDRPLAPNQAFERAFGLRLDRKLANTTFA